jgi:penicillin-binding protein 1A
MNTDAVQPTRFAHFRHLPGRITPFLRRAWGRTWVKVLAILALLGLLFYLLLWAIFTRDLPSAESLLTYEPPLPSNVRGINGEPIQTFARERRVQLDYEE